MGEATTPFRTRWFAGFTQPVEANTGALVWTGVSIALGYFAIHCAFDALFMVTWGFPQGAVPAWRIDLVWTDLVNAALIGYLPAALAISQRGIARDLSELRPGGWVDRVLHEANTEEDVVRRVRHLPDDVRVVGDKALFDHGLLGLHSVKGHDLVELGARAYRRAGELLELLAEDRRLPSTRKVWSSCGSASP